MFICTPRSVEGGPLKPWGTAGLRSTIFATKRRPPLLVERHVELALAALEERYRGAEAKRLEVLGLAVRLVGVLVHVLFVEVEQVGVLRAAVGLVEEVARLLSRGRRELPNALLDLVRFALPDRPLRNNDKRHLLPSFRSDSVPEDTDTLYLHLDDVPLVQVAIRLDAGAALRRP